MASSLDKNLPDVPLRILVVEPFGGGSHQAHYRGWQRHSIHEFTVLELPAVHWKWRSRHASYTLARQANELVDSGQQFDAVFCSDMLNLPEWKGFASDSLRQLPTVAYFHENQLTYPLAADEKRDFHFGYSNILSVLAAEEVWFNSRYHCDEFSVAAQDWLGRMPDYHHASEFKAKFDKARVLYPGIDPPAAICNKQRSPIPTVGWVARWEHDKQPDLFVDALIELMDRNIDFELILLGQQFRTVPKCLERLRREAASRIVHEGFADSRDKYWDLLAQIDVVVSTAIHEFFGIGIVEAVAAGAYPCLPKRLAYPEVLQLAENPRRQDCFYENDVELVDHLQRLLQRQDLRTEQFQFKERFAWKELAKNYDARMVQLVRGRD